MFVVILCLNCNVDFYTFVKDVKVKNGIITAIDEIHTMHYVWTLSVLNHLLI